MPFDQPPGMGMPPMGGAVPPPAGPEAMMPPAFPSTQPDAVAMAMADALASIRGADHEALAQQQEMALMQAHPLIQAMLAPPAPPMQGFGEGALPPGVPPLPPMAA